VVVRVLVAGWGSLIDVAFVAGVPAPGSAAVRACRPGWGAIGYSVLVVSAGTPSVAGVGRVWW